jgi:hypothetical protein
MTRTNLRIIILTEQPRTAAESLQQIVPELIEAEGVVARLKRLMDAERVRLAKERGVAFVREEQVRREFGRL